MDAEGEAEARDISLSDVDALLQAAGLEVPASRLPGLLEDYEQIRLMAARLRSAERTRS